MGRYLAMGAAFLALSTTSVLANEWTGFYAGAGIGNLEVDTSVPGVKENDLSYGVHAGYRFDAGRWVFGGNSSMSGRISNLCRMPSLQIG